MLINKCEDAGIKHFNNFEALFEYSNDMKDIYKNIREYNPHKKQNILTLFDNFISDMLSNKNLNPNSNKIIHYR